MDYTTIPSEETIQKTAGAIKGRGVDVIIVDTGADALTTIQGMVPKGVSVMNASSTTLEQIGFIAYLKSGDHGWNNLHESILKEPDPKKQEELRKQSILSEYFLGSVHAIAETGELVTASATGSQIPGYAFSAPHMIWVASVQKITPTLADAMMRVREYVYPLEDKRMKATGAAGSQLSRILINEREFVQNRATMILVRQPLGF